MIQDPNFKIIAGEVITYDREQEFLKKNITLVVLVTNPLILTWGKHAPINS